LLLPLTPVGYALLWLLMPAEGPHGRPVNGRLRNTVAWLLLVGSGGLVALLGARELVVAGLPGAGAVALGAAMGGTTAVLPWSPLLAWRVLTVVQVLVLVGMAGWAGGPGLPGWSLPLAGLPVLAVTLLLVGMRHPRPVTVGVGTITVMLGLLSAASSAFPPFLTPVVAAGAVGVLVAGGLERSRRAVRRRMAQQVVRHEQDRARRAVLEERARIARELHDVLAHHLSLIAIQAEAAPHKAADLPDPLRASLEAIRDAAREALGGARMIVGLLRLDDRPDDIGAARAPTPGLAELDDLVDRVRRAGLDVAARVHGVPVPLPLGVDVSAYRIVQEALSNVARHAPSARAEVTVRYRPTSVAVQVTNDGGPAEVGGGGHGLLGMRERVAALGGRLRVGPTDDGFAVCAELPVRTGDGH
jgi:signal transduction histidine kinase